MSSLQGFICCVSLEGIEQGMKQPDLFRSPPGSIHLSHGVFASSWGTSEI